MSLGEAVIDIGANTAGFRSDVEKGVDSGLKSASKSMQNIGGKMQGIGAKMTASITAPIIGIGVASVKTAGDFEASMNVLQAATGTSDAAMKTLEKQAISLGGSTVFSANEAAEAMLELGKAGFSTAEITAAVPQVMNLAATEGLALANASGIVSSALSQFSLDAGEAGQVVNALAGASNASRSSVATLSESMKLVGSAAAGVGLSVQETAGTLAALSDSGLDGSVAGTSLAAMFNRLVPQTKKATAAMEELGLDFVKGNGQFEDITNIAQQLQDRLSGLSPAARKVKLSQIFGNDASTLAAVNAVMKAGEGGIRDYTKAASDQNAASKLAEARMKGVKGAVEKMSGALETAGLVIGQALIPVVTKVADFIGRMAEKFSTLSPQAQKVVLVIAAVAAAIGPLLVVAGTLIASVGAIAGAFAGVTLAIAAPVIAIGLIVGAVALLLARSEKARSVVMEAFTSIKTAIMGAIGPVTAMIQGQLLPAFESMWPIIEKVGVIILQVFAGAVVGAIKGAIQALSGIVQVITGIVQVVSGVLTGDWSRAWEGVKNIVGGVLDTIVGLIKVWLNVGVLGLFRKGFGLLKGLVTGSWSVIKGLFSKGTAVIGTVLKKIGQIITAPFRLGFNLLRGIVRGAWNGIKAVFTGALNGIGTALSVAWGAWRSVVQGGLNLIRGLFSSGWNALKGVVSTAFNAIKGAVTTGVNNAVNVVKGLPGKAAGIITGAIGQLKSAGSALIGGLVAGVTERMDDAINAVKNGLGKLKGLLPGSPIKWGPLVSWNNGGAGKRLMDLLARGIIAGIPAVISAVEGMTSMIANNFVALENGPAVTAALDTFDRITTGIEEATAQQLEVQTKAYDKDIAAQKRALEKKYAGKDEQKKLKRKLEELEEAQAAHHRKMERGAKAASAALKAQALIDRNAIMAQAAEWDRLSVSLEGVREAYDNALTDLTSKTEEMRSLARSVADSLIESVFKVEDPDVPPTFENIIANLTDQEAAAKRYGEVMEQLAGLGLNATSFQQIADEGVAGLAAAEALLAGGQAGVEQVNQLQGSINAYAEKAGNTVANYLLGAGVALAQSTVDSFAAQEASLVSQMTTLGQAIATAFQNAIATVSLPAGTVAAADGTSAGKHMWTPIGPNNKKCSVCHKARQNAIHTNRGNNNASGTMSSSGGWGMMNERGPELVKLPDGSRVYPAHQTERMMGNDQRPVEIKVALPTGDPEAAAMAVMNRLVGRL